MTLADLRSTHVTATPPSNSPASARHAADPSIGELVAEASASFSTLIRSELDLARLEVTASLKKGGISVGAFIVAGVVVLFSFTFLFLSLAALLARYVMPLWAAYLTVFGFLVVVAIALALFGRWMVTRVKAPERTIATTKDTVSFFKEATKRG
jgi:hypothetical protein